MSNSTGHAEIDQHHLIIENTAKKLTSFCQEKEQNQDTSCAECSLQKRLICTSTFDTLYNEIISLFRGHNSYEEKMMELLPNTQKCQTHIKNHKLSHKLLLKQIKKLLDELDREHPRTNGNKLFEVINRYYLGEHLSTYDNDMTNFLDSSNINDKGFDHELVKILDHYVFKNRPKNMTLSSDALIEKKKRLEVHGCFESLTPAQRAVFWLVVAGKKNKEIANELDVSINTIKSHRSAVYDKMGVKSVFELIKKTNILQ